MASYSQTSFVGGMNMALDDSRIGDSEYQLGINVRNRFGDLRPIKRPLEISTGLTAGKPIQGIYSVGDFLIIAQAGVAKYKHRLSDTWVDLWNSASSYYLDPAVDTIYFQSVPSSNRGFAYKSTGTTSGVTVDTSATPPTRTSAGIVVQDGINQPNLIEFKSSGSSAFVSVRKCRTYAEHNTTIDGVVEREYVPVGKQMMYFNGKLYIISPDGTIIYHSVSGRPLDFVIAINTSGDKISSDEDVGGAAAISYSVSYDPITCIAPLNTDSFFVGTSSASYAVTPDNNRLLFGEPMFSKKYLFGTSAVNHYSFVDILGDFAFIDSDGLRSFNAVQQLRNEGRNSAFSMSVAKLFDNIVQDSTLSAAISFDNYGLFSMRTIYGNVIVVYDTMSKKFVSIDTYQDGDDAEAVESGGLTTGGHDAGSLSYGFGIIKQFTKISTNTAHELYAVTDTGELLKFYAGAKYLQASVTTRAWSSGDPRVEQKPLELRTLFSNVSAWESKSVTLTGGTYYPGSGAPAGGYYTEGTDEKTISVAAIPYALASGTVISFAGTNTQTGGLFTMTADAAIGATALVGTVSSSGGLSNTDSPDGYVRFTGAGTAKASMYANGSFSTTPGIISKTMTSPTAVSTEYGIKFSDLYPLVWNADNTMQNILFNFQQGRYGWKVNYVVSWDNSAYLSIIQTDSKDITPKNPLLTQAYAS